jgi:hypothetical protein
VLSYAPHQVVVIPFVDEHQVRSIKRFVEIKRL